MDIAGHFHASGSYRVDSLHRLYAAQSNAEHVPHVAQGIRALEQDDFKIVVVERSAARDLEVPAVISDAAGEREPAAVDVAVDECVEIADALSDVGESREPIRQFSRAGLKRRIQVIDDFGVEPGSGHGQ